MASPLNQSGRAVRWSSGEVGGAPESQQVVVPKINDEDSPKCVCVCVCVCVLCPRVRALRSYEGGAAAAAAAVVAVGVAAGQVGRGHEREALVRTAVLSQRVHALLAVGLPSVRHRTVTVGVPRHQVHAVLERK